MNQIRTAEAAPADALAQSASRLLLLAPVGSLVETLGARLEEVGFELTRCATVAEAHEVLRRIRFDAVLTLPELTGESGYDLVPFIAGQGLALPVLIVSAVIDGAIVTEAQRRGATDVLDAEAPADELEMGIQRAIGRSETNPPRILVVDDDPLVRKLIKVILEQDGSEVVEASSALQAWELLYKSRFHLVLSDIWMADHSGLDLLRNIKARKLRIPVILVTGRPTDEALKQARILGAVSVVAKSADILPIKQTVRQVLENLGYQKPAPVARRA